MPLTDIRNQNISHKVIGSDGQLLLGKNYAGQHVLVEEQDVGVWLVRVTDNIPYKERWFHEPAHQDQLKTALDWVSTHEAKTDNTDAILASLVKDKPNV